MDDLLVCEVRVRLVSEHHQLPQRAAQTPATARQAQSGELRRRAYPGILGIRFATGEKNVHVFCQTHLSMN